MQLSEYKPIKNAANVVTARTITAAEENTAVQMYGLRPATVKLTVHTAVSTEF